MKYIFKLIWCLNYQYKVLIDDTGRQVKNVIQSTADEIDAKIIKIEVMPDHVHLLIGVDHSYGIKKAV